MISLEDCVAMCGLSPEEVEAVSEHEHIPEVAATAFADYLLHQAGGPERIRTMIIEDIQKALADGRIEHAGQLFSVLRHFLAENPKAREHLAHY